jgi:hypothetical protein
LPVYLEYSRGAYTWPYLIFLISLGRIVHNMIRKQNISGADNEQKEKPDSYC